MIRGTPDMPRWQPKGESVEEREARVCTAQGLSLPRSGHQPVPASKAAVPRIQHLQGSGHERI